MRSPWPEKAGVAAVRHHGAMLDYAMLPLAREVVAEAARYGKPEG